ncbi:hypothetical protein CsSME_00040302 [Camellia sinensis var. sinensis]
MTVHNKSVSEPDFGKTPRLRWNPMIKSSSYLQRIGVLNNNAIVLSVFYRTKVESDDHVLLHCLLIWLLWSHVIRWRGLFWALLGSVNDLLQWWAGVNLSKLERKI